MSQAAGLDEFWFQKLPFEHGALWKVEFTKGMRNKGLLDNNLSCGFYQLPMNSIWDPWIKAMHMQLEFLQDAGHPVNSNLP